MNAEYNHQIFGGDISDYFVTNNSTLPFRSNNNNNGRDLTQVYSTEVQSKGSIDTTGLVSVGVNLNNLIIDRSQDPLQAILNNTLTQIAKDVGLEVDPSISSATLPDILNPKNQTQDDIHRSQDAVAAALKELKELGAL